MNCNDFKRWMLEVNPADLDFKLKKDKKFSVKENDHDIKIWSESNLVYAMVLQKMPKLTKMPKIVVPLCSVVK